MAKSQHEYTVTNKLCFSEYVILQQCTSIQPHLNKIKFRAGLNINTASFSPVKNHTQGHTEFSDYDSFL